jgi:thiol-disulfide isomerase/thioredoxin
MKKILFLFIVLMIGSCSIKKNELELKKVIITGKVLNFNPDNLNINLSVNRIGIRQAPLIAKIDSNGFFKTSFESYIPTDVWLMYKTNFLILTHPGDSIYIEFDGGKEERPDILDQIKFKGNNSKQNQEASIFQLMYFSSNLYTDWDRKNRAVKDYNEIGYKSFMDSLHNEGIKILKRFEKETSPSEETKNWARIFLDVECDRDLLQYPIEHRNANRLKRDEWSVPLTYFNFLENRFTIDRSTLLNAYSLSAFVNAYNALYIFELIKEENNQFFNSSGSINKHPEKTDSIIFFGTIKNTPDPLLRQMVLTEMLGQRLQRSDIIMFEKYENEIWKYIKEPYLKEPLLNLYNQTKMSLNKPKLASDAVFKKLDGTTIKSSIDSIIRINSGKVIYMDCWATWCGPCIAEMPNSKKLIEEFKEKEVAFVFICIESEENLWKSILVKSEIGGQHLLLSKNQSSDFRSVFGINGIPHYILFDKKGVINEINASPPMTCKDKIYQLLNEK